MVWCTPDITAEKQPTVVIDLPPATVTTYWTESYTSTATVTPENGGQLTVIVEIPGVPTSTSTWTGSYTTLTTVTGTDGVETPVVEVPSSYTSTIWPSAWITSSIFVSPPSPSMSYHSGGWNSSYVQSSITKSNGAGYSSSSRNSAPPGASISSVSMSQSSELPSPVSETRTFVAAISGASGATEVVTSTRTSTFCPESTSSKPSYTTEIYTSVATVSYGHGSSRDTTLSLNFFFLACTSRKLIEKPHRTPKKSSLKRYSMVSRQAQKRLTKEYKTIQTNPSPYITAKPNGENILEWHYVITGPPGTPYENGQYHGLLRFPSVYPFKPPSISMVTPDGRFQCNTRLCLS